MAEIVEKIKGTPREIPCGFPYSTAMNVEWLGALMSNKAVVSAHDAYSLYHNEM